MKRKLQVFISSTYSDLKEERQAAVEAILKAGHIPARMELFTAGDKSQMATIERWIDESDVYMLILGGRYGSVEPTTELSYTELEYDYAVSHGKPTFAVAISEAGLEEKVRSGGTSFIKKTNSKALAQFREKVPKNISSFFNDPKDIKLCVYESMSELMTNPSLKGWIAAEEIPETKLLQEQIKSLREENDALTEKPRKLEAAAKTQLGDSTPAQDQELMKVLRAIEIKVPAKLTGDKEITSNLLKIALIQRDRLTNGVTNHMGMSEIDQFLYFNILPKLQNHALADNEKVAGVRYRRSYLNKKGQMLLAELDRTSLLAKAKQSAASAEPAAKERSTASEETPAHEEMLAVKPSKPKRQHKKS
jgi:hypothetical protein